MNKILITIVVNLFFFGCGNRKAVSYGDYNIDSIVVKYLHKDITFSRPPRGIDLLNWKSVKKHEALREEYARMIDTVITNDQYLKEIKKEIENLKSGKCYDEYAFLASIVFYENNTQDTISVSYADGQYLIIYNSICCKENRRLEHLLFKYSDYYFWFPSVCQNIRKVNE